MKNLLHLKYEMHKGVNYLFYVFIIGLGIFIGLGLKKIFLFDFNFPGFLKENLKFLFN